MSFLFLPNRVGPFMVTRYAILQHSMNDQFYDYLHTKRLSFVQNMNITAPQGGISKPLKLPSSLILPLFRLITVHITLLSGPSPSD
jgi:hypothetical protein